MSPGYLRPAVETNEDIAWGSSQTSVPSKMSSDIPEMSNYRSTSPNAGSARPSMSTRRHSDMPRGDSSMRDRPWGSSSDGEAEEEGIKANHARPRSPSRISRHRTQSSERKHASVGSDASNSVIPTLHSRRRSPEKVDRTSMSPTSRAKPDVLSFLDRDSPNLTAESIKRTLEASTQWHRDPRSTSPRSSVGSSSASSTGRGSNRDSEQDSEAHTSPGSSVDGDIISTTFVQDLSKIPQDLPQQDTKSTVDSKPAAPRKKQPKDKEYHYGTPEMPRGNANLPHLPPNALTPRVSNPGQGHVKHLPRAEKLPLTGYELLAARLSTTSHTSHSRRHHHPASPSTSTTSSGRSSPDTTAEPALKPIYRRFESLNHRLLLHLQDELSELEEQLHRLDTADTQTRRLQNCILPASRRAGHMSGGELQWHKTDILGKIGFKLGQYNHALSSFTAAQGLPSPDMEDVEVYRTYLATCHPIAEIETRFLEAGDDLVSLARETTVRGRSGRRMRSGSGSGESCSSELEEEEEFGRRRGGGGYSSAALSDEAPTPRQGSLGGAGLLPPNKTTRFPFGTGATVGGAFLPTPSLSPASSVAGDCSRPGSSSASAGGKHGEQQRLITASSPMARVFLSESSSPYLLAAVLVLLPVLLLRMVEGLAARLAVVAILMGMVFLLGQVLLLVAANGSGRGQQGEHQFLQLLGRRLEGRDVGLYGAAMAAVAAVS